MDKRLRSALLIAGVMMLMLLLPADANAHVKWFADFSFTDKPLTLNEAVTPIFIGLALLSCVTIGALVFVDRKLTDFAWYQRINDWLSDRRDSSLTVMRVAAGASLLMSWQADALLVPELPTPFAWVGWLQFIIVLLLLTRRTTPIAGGGLFVLWIIGVTQVGAFHMLDYLLFLGVGWYLLVSQTDNEMIRDSGIPALYGSVGFSLFWVGLEKIIYPEWSAYILAENPQLTLGLPVDFFIIAAAFVELSLGYLLIIGLLGRPLSVVITLVFFLTTTVFGKTEIIGHTIIHGALIVFLLEGVGKTYKPPIDIHQRLPLRTAFAAVNFALVLVLLGVPYVLGAQARYRDAIGVAQVADVCAGVVEAAEGATAPTFSIKGSDEDGYTLTLDATSGDHAHVYLDGIRVGSTEDGRFTLPRLATGIYDVEVVAASGEHFELALKGQRLATMQRLVVGL